VLFSSFAMTTILVEVNEDVGLETPLKKEKFVVRVVKLYWMYKRLVCSL